MCNKKQSNKVLQDGINEYKMYSAYVHIPFCEHRCHYCDFNTYTGMKALIPEYISALVEEICIVTAKTTKLPIHSIYFGGGTPSLVPINLYEELMYAFQSQFIMANDCEITIEVNPGTLTLKYLQDLRKLGINRISIGIQSTASFDLVRLDRIHDVDDILNSVRFSRKAGFDNINLDMIFSLPWQDLSSWEQSLSRAVALKPDHFSLYSLIIEPGTLLFDWYQKGLISTQDQDLEGEMYQLAMNLLDDAGFDQYEISSWAKSCKDCSFQSRHNKQYWTNQPYLGFGVGAHGYAANTRTVNAKTIPDYIRRIHQEKADKSAFPASPATVSTELVDKRTQMKDFMLLGLRLVMVGVSAAQFKTLYGSSMIEEFRHEIESLLKKGIVEWFGGGESRLRLTQRGVMIANQAFMEFV